MIKVKIYVFDKKKQLLFSGEPGKAYPNMNRYGSELPDKPASEALVLIFPEGEAIVIDTKEDSKR